MDRRDFVRHVSAGLAAATLPGCMHLRSSSPQPRMPSRLGLELYTVRRELALDPERTLMEVAAIGYRDAEVVWGLLRQPVPEFRAMLDRAGLRAPSGHIGTNFFDDWDRHLDDAKAMGHEYVIVASLPEDSTRTLDGWRRWADRFNERGAVARRHDLWLGFHTEPNDVKPIDGQVPYDVFVERLDPSVVRLQLDIGNVAAGGGDPLAYVQRWRDRYWSYHVKDVKAVGATADTELGEGVLDIRRILRAAGDLSHKLLYVEQEGSTDSLASARRDYAFLRGFER